MRMAVVAAGFTPGEADQLRRAMGAWRRPGLIDKFRRKLTEGMRSTGLSQQYAEAVFRQIRGFGEYGFPESHAASFALLVYVSAWLKCHYHEAFTAALLNSQPMGFYAPAQLVRDARRHGVEVRPVDVNWSGWESTLEEGRRSEVGKRKAGEGSGFRVQGSEVRSQKSEARSSIHRSSIINHQSSIINHHSLRLGFHMLQGMSEGHGRRIEEARDGVAFRSLEDFGRRTGLGRSVITRLAKAGTFGSLKLGRREALWHALGQDQRELPLFDREGAEVRSQESEVRSQKFDSSFIIHHSSFIKDQSFPLPKMSAAEEVLADYRTQGLSLEGHPMEFLREGLNRLGVSPAAWLKRLLNGGPVRVAGIVLVRQRPGTAKGITFVTLEDETGVANLIIRPDVWKRWRTAALGATILLAHGRLQRQGRVIHVLTTKLENLSSRMKELGSKSRDFC